MTDKEIRDRIKLFSEQILTGNYSCEEVKGIQKQIDEFCAQNHVTVEQMDILAESGAGEMLYMLTS